MVLNSNLKAPVNKSEIIKWAAGSRRPIPLFSHVRDQSFAQLLGIDENALLDDLFQHRLTQRALLRYINEHPGWLSDSFVNTLSLIQHRNLLRLARQIEALEEIQAALPNNSKPLIILKGLSAYALTDETSLIRHSNDIDVCYDDLNLLWDIMTNLGYQGKRHYTYEYAKFKKSGITFDVHHHYPILSYPYKREEIGILSAGPEGSRSYIKPGAEYPIENDFSYENMLSNVVIGRARGTQKLNVLNEEALVLVLCAHLFKNYITQPHYMTESRQVRLGEIADVATLSQSEGFDKDYFYHLVSEHTAHDAVEFVCNLLMYYDLPYSNLNDNFQSVNFPFPANLCCGGWVVLDTEEEWLFPRKTKTILELIGGRDSLVLPVAEHQGKQILDNPSGKPERPSLTLVVSSEYSQQSLDAQKNSVNSTLEIFAHLSEKKFHLNISISKPTPFMDLKVHGGGDWVWNVVVENSTIKSHSYKEEIFVLPVHAELYLDNKQDVCIIAAQFPVESVPLLFTKGGQPLLISVSFHSIDQDTSMLIKVVEYVPAIFKYSS